MTSPPSSRCRRWASPSRRSATTSSTKAGRSCAACRMAAATRSTAARDRSRFEGAKFEYLAASTFLDNGQTLFPPYTVRTFDGVKVGFIGLTLEGTPDVITPAARVGITFKDEAETVNALVPKLKSRRRRGHRRAAARRRLHQRHARRLPRPHGNDHRDRAEVRQGGGRRRHRPHQRHLHLHARRPPRHQRRRLRHAGHRHLDADRPEKRRRHRREGARHRHPPGRLGRGSRPGRPHRRLQETGRTADDPTRRPDHRGGHPQERRGRRKRARRHHRRLHARSRAPAGQGRHRLHESRRHPRRPALPRQWPRHLRRHLRRPALRQRTRRPHAHRRRHRDDPEAAIPAGRQQHPAGLGRLHLHLAPARRPADRDRPRFGEAQRPAARRQRSPIASSPTTSSSAAATASPASRPEPTASPSAATSMRWRPG